MFTCSTLTRGKHYATIAQVEYEYLKQESVDYRYTKEALTTLFDIQVAKLPLKEIKGQNILLLILPMNLLTLLKLLLLLSLLIIKMVLSAMSNQVKFVILQLRKMMHQVNMI